MRKHCSFVITVLALGLTLLAVEELSAQTASPFRGLDIRTALPASARVKSDASFYPPFEGFNYSKTKIAGIATEIPIPNRQPFVLGLEVATATVEYEGSWKVFIGLQRNEQSDPLGKRANLRRTCTDAFGRTIYNRADNAKRRQFDVDGVQTPGYLFVFDFAEVVVPFGGQCWWELTIRKGIAPVGDYLLDIRLDATEPVPE